MLRQFSHERYAEAAYLAIRLSLGIKVRSPLSSAHAEPSQGIFERLLETEEFEDGEIDGWMEAQTAFVWS
jgi:hypothetical protein